ncbi:MAG: acyl-CoA thioesterase [Hominimerdicola sp.]
MKLTPFIRKANYYETDRMDIIHHSNYIRWFEEARIDILDQMGFPFTEIEGRGLMVPVISVECQYKFPIKFGDEFQIDCKITDFNGCKFSMEYVVTNLTTGKLSCTGKSSHCFTDGNLKPVRIKNSYPELYQAYLSVME